MNAKPANSRNMPGWRERGAACEEALRKLERNYLRRYGVWNLDDLPMAAWAALSLELDRIIREYRPDVWAAVHGNEMIR